MPPDVFHDREFPAGVFGQSESFYAGVVGLNSNDSGKDIKGYPQIGVGVAGVGNGVQGGIGVLGSAWGLVSWRDPDSGNMDFARGVNAGVMGYGGDNLTNHTGGKAAAGVVGIGSGDGGEGVRGVSQSNDPGVVGHCNGLGPAVQGISVGSGPAVEGLGGTGYAGFFAGKVSISDQLQLGNDSLAIKLPSAGGSLTAGQVLSVNHIGQVVVCETEYDTAVVGIVPGLPGNENPSPSDVFIPGIVLGEQDQNNIPNMAPVPGPPNPPVKVVILGTTWCLADATTTPIRPGDPLTSSATTGMCQRASDPTKAFGAVIGKALTALQSGKGEVRVLVNLR